MPELNDGPAASHRPPQPFGLAWNQPSIILSVVTDVLGSHDTELLRYLRSRLIRGFPRFIRDRLTCTRAFGDDPHTRALLLVSYFGRRIKVRGCHLAFAIPGFPSVRIHWPVQPQNRFLSTYGTLLPLQPSIVTTIEPLAPMMDTAWQRCRLELVWRDFKRYLLAAFRVTHPSCALTNHSKRRTVRNVATFR